MATRTLITFIDDLDGNPIEGLAGNDKPTVEFGLDGNTYEIDLRPEHADQLRNALSTYVTAATKVTTASRRGKSRSNAKATAATVPRTELDPAPKVVREWARNKGIDVPATGRVPQRAYDAWHEAHRK